MSEEPEKKAPTQAFAQGRDLEGEITSSLIINWFLLLPALVVLFVFLAWAETRYYVPGVFIDERFHVPMVQQYLAGDFFAWDSKITTPPGTYIIGYLWSKTIQLLHLPVDPAGLSSLRVLNAIGGTVALPLALHPLFTLNPIGWWPATIVLCPILSTYYTLFYTEVWSTVFIVASFSTAVGLPFGETKSVKVSALLGFISIWFRQTNIVWQVLIMALVIERRAMIQKNFTDYFLNNCLKFIIQAVEDFNEVVLPYLFNFVAFTCFLVYNRGITLGDKENHVAGLHFAQVFYCLTFLTILSWPAWISLDYIMFYLRRYKYLPFGVIFELLIVIFFIRFFTVVHPFLLADNRHYTFYIWRKIIGLTWYTKYLMAPVYHFSIFTILSMLNENAFYFSSTRELPFKRTAELPLKPTGISNLAYIFCVLATIVPSPLFEPRYYILPYIFYRVLVSVQYETFFPGEPIQGITMRRLGCELAWFLMINVVTLGIYVFYTFEWADEPMLQRIIW
ncbi:CYFA0S03e00364g1_1 [Cyberlindnera fabianii]|uniref:Dol-P-Glc:Glc(2)Man(9)GlcNAc(2)-PP-Dol alpha-1,2-glucosyltransferase n=1 Tax=Cyberlindnera fabianii TaxID=36022 RepID=A0A061AWS3_CYBFA|nr:hypothetical protein BON22_4604 [Cyberlindnera fabianii]CDR39164.1 CYFA0S03e00364g1_1 [Cyberlindnera fabianii]